eukprot:COSAG01_NODE_47888_length_386_cov_0.682927_1_plen_50_part_10
MRGAVAPPYINTQLSRRVAAAEAGSNRGGVASLTIGSDEEVGLVLQAQCV